MDSKILKFISKKNQGKNFQAGEIEEIIDLFDKKELSEEIMGLFLKSVQKQGLNKEETLAFFSSVYKRSKKVDIFKADKKELTIDKHSTGGVGDKISLVLLPLFECLGIKCFKLTGGRLGHTGGTFDKLKSFPKIQLNYSKEEFTKLTKTNLCLISAPITHVCELEKKIYDLRTKTNTTQSVDLIVNSILIKKIILSNDILLLDIKVGNGSLFKSTCEIQRFVQLVELICKKYKRKYKIVYSNMNQPLGNAVGNKMEILETIEILSGKNVPDVIELTTEICAYALVLTKKSTNFSAAKKLVVNTLKTGKALKFFQKLIERQGGDWHSLVSNPQPKTIYKITIKSKKKGYFFFQSAFVIGEFFNAISLDEKKNLDYESGIFFFKKNNSFVNKGDDLFSFYTNLQDVEKFTKMADKLFVIRNEPKKSTPTILTNLFK